MIDAAARWYAAQLAGAARPREILAARGVDAAAIARFGIGFAPPKPSVAGCSLAPEQLGAAGLMFEVSEGRDAGLWRDRFRNRIMIPIHDARGRAIGFGGRGGDGMDPKYLNSPDSAMFDKGRVLFNLHRASAPARAARRLVIVEGYFGVIALDAAGIPETVASMGTALTEHQLERAWRVVDCPVLLFDGDAAGRRAALRVAERALPFVGSSASVSARSLQIGMLPEGQDPDDAVRGAVSLDEGRAAIEAAIVAAVPLARFFFDRVVEGAEKGGPEGVADIWRRLEASARTIRDDETRAQYLAAWRARFEREVSLSAASMPTLPPLHAQIEAEGGGYAWPEAEDESERRLIMITRRLLDIRRQRAELTRAANDVLAMAKAIGFDRNALNAVVRDIEADAAGREDHEAAWALYRRVLGVKPYTNADGDMVVPLAGQAARDLLEYKKKLDIWNLECDELEKRLGVAETERVSSEACDAHDEALKAVLASPAPTLAAVLHKLRLIDEWGLDNSGIIADMERFAQMRA
ncbi:MAG: toprim domain-containing protein [Sphingomonas sp.]